MIKISVIVPIYNAEQYLRNCLDSILSQNLLEKEVICIDDGSTDDSLEIIKEYVMEYDNIKIFHQENKGAGPARNLGMEHVKGKYIMFMDADDYYPDSEVLQKMYDAAEREQVLICGGNIVTHEGKHISTHWFSEKRIWKYEEFQELYYFYRYIYNAQMLKDNHIIFPEYRRFEDPPFLVRAMICAGKFYAINNIVYIYRCGYKEIKYTYEKIIEVLQGIKAICIDANKNRLDRIYNEIFRYMTQDYRDVIYKYIYYRNKNVIQLVDDIVNEICIEDMKEYFSINTVEKYLQDCQKEKEHIFEQLEKYERIIIYGAGKIGKLTIKVLLELGANIIGIAVTSKSNIGFVDAFEVKEITEYLPYVEDILVVIGTGISYQEEIKLYLYNLGFRNILQYDYNKIRFMEELKIENKK